MINWRKQNWPLIFLIIVLLSLDLYRKELFFTIFIIYGLLIYLIASKLVNRKLRLVLAIIIWVAFSIVGGLIYYVNHYLPHGPSYSTGEYVCMNDDRGPCSLEYKEDLRNLNIPNWAKFFKEGKGMLLWFGLGFAGIVTSNKKDEEIEI